MVMFLSKDKVIRRLFVAAAYLCFTVAALLIVWAFVSKIHFLEEKYVQYINWLADFERQIASIGDRWLMVLVVWLLYFVKTGLPLYPVSIICVASALVFNTPKAIVINFVGLAMMFTVKYIMGTNTVKSSLWLIHKSSIVTRIIESGDKGNPWVLVIFRLLPCMPDNTVSQIYGAMNFPYWKYMLISIVAYAPKMISYIIIGRSVLNSFSLTLSIPLVVLTLVSGGTLLAMSKLWNKKDKTQEDT